MLYVYNIVAISQNRQKEVFRGVRPMNLGELLGMVEVECSRRHFDCVGRLTFILSQTFYNISESSRC